MSEIVVEIGMHELVELPDHSPARIESHARVKGKVPFQYKLTETSESPYRDTYIFKFEERTE